MTQSTEYIFTLKYRLAAEDCNQDELVERLGAAGCTDATVGLGQAGRLALAFTREAESAEAALKSALKDVKAIIPGATLIEAAPDFVGLTDVADTIGVTRQNMRKLMLSNASTFPSPVHEGSATVWHLADILDWLDAKGSYSLERSIQEIARTTMQINLIKAATQLSVKPSKELQLLVG
jgi:predicted DNA-binding transcriptional regulator AlpA